MATLGQSSLGTMRVNAARLNYHTRTPYITVNGTDRTSKVRIEQAQVRQSLSNTPDTCTLRVSGFTPSAGQEVKLYTGSTATTELLFGGIIQRVTQVYESLQANVAYDVECVDYTWLLDRRLVTKSYVNQSATTIAKDLISTFTSGFTSANVQGGLTWVSVSFTYATVSQALTQLAQLVGARWKLTPTKDLRFYVPPGGMATNFPDPDTLTASTVTDDHPLEALTDLAQVRTRVYVTGGATNTSVSTAVHIPQGAHVIPVSAASPFGSSSGKVQVTSTIARSTPSSPAITQTDTVSYTGTARASLVAAPTSVTGITLTFATGAGALSTNSAYQWAFSYVTSNGETALSPRISGYTASNTEVTITVPSSGALYVYTNNPLGTTITPPDPSITGIRLYRTLANGEQLYFVSTTTVGANNWPTSIVDTAADSDLGTVPPPTTTAGIPQGTGSTTANSGAAAGATSVSVANCTVFDSAGGYAISGDVIFQYTSYSIPGSAGNNIAGTLTTVALPALVASGATITAVPALTGCTCTTNAITPTPPSWYGAIGSSAGPSVGTAYQWGVTYVTAAGESTISQLSQAVVPPSTPTSVVGSNSGTGSGPTNTGVYSYKVATIDATGAMSAVSAASGNFTSNGTRGSVSATIQSGLVAGQVFVYRTLAGGSTYFLCPTLTNQSIVGTSFTCQDGNTDASLVTSLTSHWVQKYTLYQIPISGSNVTSRKLYRTNASGTLGLLTTLADNTTISYVDQTADGSLGAAPPLVDTANAAGVPLLPSGTSVTPFAMVEDTAAQSTLAALEGGDGIHEDVITNTPASTTVGMTTIGQAALSLFKAQEAKATFTAADYKLQPGATVSVSIGSPTNVSGSYIVQSVSTTRLGIVGSSSHYVYPLKTVELGQTRFTLDDLLRRVALT